MSQSGRAAAVAAMREAGIGDAAVAVFEHNYGLLDAGVDGLIYEDELEPLEHVESLESVDVGEDEGCEALAHTAMIKLNGGLGTSMGLAAAKTLLPVRDGLSFLDVIARQVLAAREHYDVALPLLLMNSFRTERDTIAALGAYPELATDGLPLTFVQNQEPKLDAETLEPISWPADPQLAWCPPGHGDLYNVLTDTGLIERLLERDVRYVCVANGDNLGAVPSPELAGWFARSGAPFAAEACRRTVNDRKGGHFARRRDDGRIVLRESAMVAPGEFEFFADEHRHRFFNTNNLWFDLAQLQQALRERHGVLGLPLIRNVKTVDPRDPDSPRVIQLETGMGSAIETFEGAAIIEVPRSRFLPVKTTNELLLVRSDCYTLGDDFSLQATAPAQPEIRLDSRYFQRIADFDERVPQPPSLREATRFVVNGDWSFAPGTVVVGDVELPEPERTGVASGELR